MSAAIRSDELLADERRLGLADAAPARGADDRAPAPEDTPVEVVRGEEHEVPAEVAEPPDEPIDMARDVLVVSREDDQPVEARELGAAPELLEVRVREVVGGVLPPRRPMQEVEVVVREMRRDATIEERPPERDPRSGVRPRVPGVAPAVAVHVLEVVGLPG